MNDKFVNKFMKFISGTSLLQNWVNEYLFIPVLFILFCLCFLPFNYPAFQFFAEFGSIVVGILILVTAIISYRYIQNCFLLILALGLGWTAALDLIDVVAYQGLSLLLPDRTNSELASPLWFMARFLQAATVLVAVLLMGRTISPGKVNFFIALSCFAMLSLLFASYFPDNIIPEAGLTEFKVYGEYGIILVFLTASALLAVRRERLQPKIYLGAMLACIVMALAELTTSSYFSEYDLINAAGHFLKLFSYWFVFRVLILLAIQIPFRERGNLITDLRERVKELNALYELSTISEQKELSHQQLLQSTCDLLPASFYYPEFLHVAIQSPWGDFGDKSLISENRKIEEEILLTNTQKVQIVVGYVEDAPLSDPVFLDEEYSLMSMVGTRIRDVLLRIGSNREINNLKELYALLSRINRAITKSEDRDALIGNVLQSITKSSGYSVVFIAEAEGHSTSEVFTINQHQFGLDDGQVNNIESCLKSLPNSLLYGLNSGPEHESHAPLIFTTESFEQKDISSHLRGLGFSHLILIPLLENNKINLLVGFYLHAEAPLTVEYKRLLLDMQNDLEYALWAFNEEVRRIHAEYRMMDSEDRFRAVFMKSPAPMVMFDTDGQSQGLSNQAFEEWSGIPSEIMLTPMEYLESYLLGPGKEDWISNYWKRALKEASQSEGVVQVPEVRVRHFDGSELIASAKMILVNNQILLVLTDLTEIRKQEKELLDSEVRFRSMIEEVSLPVSICLNEVFVYINPCLRELLDDKYEPLGRRISEYFTIVGNGTGAIEFSNDWGPSPGEPTVSHDVQVKGKEGEEHILNVRISNISWDGDRAYMFVGEDVTFKRQFEKQLGDSYKLLNNLSEQVPGVIYQFQLFPDGRSCFPFASERIREIYEVEPESVKGDASSAFDRLHPEDRPEVERRIQESAENLTDWREDFRAILPERGERWLSGSARPQKLDDGSVLWHGFIEDSTDRMESRLELDRTNRELERSVKGTLEALSRVVDLRDPYTAGHERRVGALAALIGSNLGLDEHEVENLRLAGLVHDIGKIAIPAEILSKPSRISESEYELIKTHVQAGYEIIKDIPLSNKIKEAVWQHHERLDGSGYPRGLKGDEVTLEARILAVSDVIESMASHRPYRPARGVDAALEEIIANSGVLYDERIVDAAIQVVNSEGFDLELL